MKRFFLSLFFLLLSFKIFGYGKELSLVSGGFSQTKISDILKKNQISLGGKYSQQFSSNMFWYGRGVFSLDFYSSSLRGEPGTNVGIEAGGGVRYYFDNLGEKIVPYGEVGGSLKKIQESLDQLNSSLYDTQGVFYNTDIGLRLILNKDYFLDLSVPLIESPLILSRKRIEYRRSGESLISEVKEENIKFALFMKSFTSFSEVKISFGMRL